MRSFTTEIHHPIGVQEMVEKKTIVIDGQEVTVTVLPPQPTPRRREAGPTKGERQRWLVDDARIKPRPPKPKKKRKRKARARKKRAELSLATKQLDAAAQQYLADL